MRLKAKIAIIIGAGQGPGQGYGIGRATALIFAREGATVICADRDLAAGEATAEIIRAEGGQALALRADVMRETDLQAMVEDVVVRFGRLDVLHYNVGVSLAGGDAKPLAITEEAFDNVNAINLRGLTMACKHALPVMQRQKSGVVLAISSIAAQASDYPTVAYKISKAGMIAYIEQIARQFAGDGVRANVILPGLMDTPMAVDTRAREWGRPREDVAAERNARVPLRRQMGTAWDVAYAGLFLASDEANFITGVSLPVDGGTLLRTGA
jgi:NAD(P)-dependent dehydrogenase (short-subunit alcohol dehydrogenase family)